MRILACSVPTEQPSVDRGRRGEPGARGLAALLDAVAAAAIHAQALEEGMRFAEGLAVDVDVVMVRSGATPVT